MSVRNGLHLVRTDALFLGGGAKWERRSIAVWSIGQTVAVPVIKWRTEGEARLLAESFLVRPVHHVEVAHLVFVGGTKKDELLTSGLRNDFIVS